MAKQTTIPVPTFILSDDELIDLAVRLEPFARGDRAYADEPSPRAAAARTAIMAELRWRGSRFRLERSAAELAQPLQITADPPTEH